MLLGAVQVEMRRYSETFLLSEVASDQGHHATSSLTILVDTSDGCPQSGRTVTRFLPEWTPPNRTSQLSLSHLVIQPAI